MTFLWHLFLKHDELVSNQACSKFKMSITREWNLECLKPETA